MASTVTIPVQVAANCSKFLVTSYIAVQSDTCITQLPDGSYEVYNQPVEVNGLELKPLTTTGSGSDLNFDTDQSEDHRRGPVEGDDPGGPNGHRDFGLWEGTIKWSLGPPSQATNRIGRQVTRSPSSTPTTRPTICSWRDSRSATRRSSSPPPAAPT